MLTDDNPRRLNSPQSVTRVIHILEALCTSPLSLAELSRKLATPKSSLAALLRGLSAADFVVFSDGVYRLGTGAFGLGSALLEARRRIQSSDIIREGMRRLADQTDETVLHAIRNDDDDTLTYVDVIESPNAVRFIVAVGDRRPLYCTSAGRALLAASPDEHVNRYLRGLKPQAWTARTETDKRHLKAAILQARIRGAAQTTDQTAVGVTGTASVIRDATGAATGALVVAAPSSRFASERAREALANAVCHAANNVSRNLGYRGSLTDGDR